MLMVLLMMPDADVADKINFNRKSTLRVQYRIFRTVLKRCGVGMNISATQETCVCNLFDGTTERAAAAHFFCVFFRLIFECLF